MNVVALVVTGEKRAENGCEDIGVDFILFTVGCNKLQVIHDQLHSGLEGERKDEGITFGS